MGFLVPIYLAALTALALPVIYHLVRRTPRGRQNFSSLMFLSPSPPRLTRKSRVDQWLLLLLRLTALALLACAFARPFLREAATLALDSLPGRRVALLVDVSASMRRRDLWQQVQKHVERELRDLGPQDEVALLAFGSRVQTVVPFDSQSNEPIGVRRELVRSALRNLQPTWEATDLGQALVTVAHDLATTADLMQSSQQSQIVLISDVQTGSRLEMLQSFEWPAEVRLAVHQVAPTAATNATVRALVDEGDSVSGDIRVRVDNAPDSKGDQFLLKWGGGSGGGATPRDVSLHVPPGQNRVARVPRPADDLSSDRIVLQGDDHDFDNVYFVVPPRRQQVTVLYVGNDLPDDPQGMLYYLGLALAHDPLYEVDIQVRGPRDQAPFAADTARLFVVTVPVPPAVEAELKARVERRATLLLAPCDDAAAPVLPRFFDDIDLAQVTPLAEGQYLLLGEIDFTHPLFHPLANPRYSDFTPIHFWRRRGVALRSPDDPRVLARFDNRDPAILERMLGAGRILGFTSGWHPDDSQLALSSKFVAIMGGILELACGRENVVRVTVGEPVPLPAATAPSPIVIRTPERGETRLAGGQTEFRQTDLPGVYHASMPEGELRFAVNVAAAEGQTAPLDLAQLGQWGVHMSREPTRAERLAGIRQQRDTELESRQQVWRWLIVASLMILMFETWLAGRAARRVVQAPEAPA
ncbi:MAG: BatA domain-containing protein [Planctomycetaceae bacterium]